jgi:hypothetical protein
MQVAKTATRRKVKTILGEHPRVPRDARIGVLDIDTPYGVPVGARLVRVNPPAGARTLGRTNEWQAPKADRIPVVASLKAPATKMFARRQIDRACYMAAISYERLYELVHVRKGVRSSDFTMPPISGLMSAGPAIEQRERAGSTLRRAEAYVRTRVGDEGLMLIRDILGTGMTIERAAVLRGEADKQSIRFFGSLFRRCLRHLAVVLGFAVKGAYGR